MNGQRDIERTLDAWFVDGPSVMPDRLFDAVLDQVERTPQQRLARLRLRLTEMNPRIRIYTALAAALLVVVAAVAVIGGGSQGPVVATQSPAATTASDIPNELRATWLSGTRSITGLAADDGVSLTFTAAGTFSMTDALTSRIEHLKSSVEVVDADSLRVVNTDATPECGAGQAGEYTWSLSASGETLQLTAVSDTCATRLDAVPGNYWRMNCPTDEDNCIGDIDAGPTDRNSSTRSSFPAATGPRGTAP